MPKIIDHEARRRQVFEGSLDLFSNHGYSGLGMRQLASALGVSTGSLYHYFPNKSSLFEGMLRHLATGHVSQAISAIGLIEEPQTRLAVVREFIISQADRIRAVLWVAIDYRRAMGDAAQPLVAEVFGVYEAGIAEHLTGGDQDKAREVLSYVMGVLVHSGLSERPVDIGPMLQAMDRLAL